MFTAKSRPNAVLCIGVIQAISTAEKPQAHGTGAYWQLNTAIVPIDQ